MSTFEVEIPPAFAKRVVDSLGADGEAWLRDLPDTLRLLGQRWRRTLGPPFALSFNYVIAVQTRWGAEEVLKIAPPWGDGELIRELYALMLYDGDGACRLLGFDESLRAILLERLTPGEMLTTVAADDDDAATRIGAEVMRRLWRPADELPDADLFKPLAEWFDAFSRHRAAYGGPGPFPPGVLEYAEALVPDLLASSPGDVLLHGDFHHHNILSSERGWLAIDPKGMVGDPGYEVGPFLLNPEISTAVKSRAELDRRLDIFAGELQYDRRRLRDWAIAHAVVSACWSAEIVGGSWPTTIAAAQNLIDHA